MKLGFWQIIQELKLILRKIVDRDDYVKALTHTAKNKPKGFFSLAKIYEQGSSVMSADAAIAYAMYCLGASQKVKDVEEKIRTLKSHLSIKDQVKANRIIKNFKQNNYVDIHPEVARENSEEADIIVQYVS